MLPNFKCENCKFLLRSLNWINLLHSIRPPLGNIMPPKQWVTGTYSQGRKLRCSADHLPAFSGEIRNTKSSTSTPSCVFTVLYVIKHVDNFTLLTPNKELPLYLSQLSDPSLSCPYLGLRLA